LRRSELTAIHIEHIQWKKEGIEILIPSSKTDQNHEGQYCAIPYGNAILCPVTALDLWLTQSGIKEGAIFRKLNKYECIGALELTPQSINHIIQRRAQDANIINAPMLSSHSLRRGLATSAARANSSLQTIMRAGRWKQVNTVIEYIEACERFTDNAASDVLHKIHQES
jgi:integrase